MGGGDKTDISWIAQEDEDHLPEYYRSLEDDPESNDEDEDYKDSSRNLIDGMEDRFHRSGPSSFLCVSFHSVFMAD